MAYISQQQKAQISAVLKPILAQYGMKGTLSIQHYSSITLTLQSGPIDFGSDNRQVNVYWIANNYQGVAQEFLLKAVDALKSAGWYDRSDSMSDYFDIAYYININVGRWDKPYVLTNQKVAA